MKYLVCLVFLASVLKGMDEPPFYSPPESPQSHSAPNSPSSIRYTYTRQELLALSSSPLSRYVKDTIKVDEIKRGVELAARAKSVSSLPDEVKGEDKTTSQTVSGACPPGKKGQPYRHRRRYPKR